MSGRVDLYSSYREFGDPALAAVRADAFGTDIGQNSWVTTDEYDHFSAWLGIASGHHVLEVASGSGGPALHLARLTGCRVTGIDRNPLGVEHATRAAAAAGAAERVRFTSADATARLPFDDGAFDALVCVDSMNHLPDRPAALAEWRRVLRPGGRALFTDPVVITGPVTNEELALRSSIGTFLFVPREVTVHFINAAGFTIVREEDRTANAALVSGRWRDSRQRHRAALVAIEGEERFAGLQRFFDAVHVLSRDRRLSRIAWVAETPAR